MPKIAVLVLQKGSKCHVRQSQERCVNTGWVSIFNRGNKSRLARAILDFGSDKQMVRVSQATGFLGAL